MCTEQNVNRAGEAGRKKYQIEGTLALSLVKHKKERKKGLKLGEEMENRKQGMKK